MIDLGSTLNESIYGVEWRYTKTWAGLWHCLIADGINTLSDDMTQLLDEKAN